MVIAGLLDVLAAVYLGEDLGRLARVMAVWLYDRIGIWTPHGTAISDLNDSKERIAGELLAFIDFTLRS
jgi:hypothetical protein